MNRRKFLLGSVSSTCFLASPVTLEASTAGTVFNIKWRNLNVGYSSINLTRIKNKVVSSIDVSINVKLLGIQLFNYDLQCEEIWENKKLKSINSNTSFSGKKAFVEGKKITGGFEIKGSAFNGIIKEEPATTSYFSTDFLKRNIWISTQDGKPLNIKASKGSKTNVQTAFGLIEATEWNITGDLNVNLFYDKQGNWVSSKFIAGGSRATFVLHKRSGNIKSIWSSA